MQKVNSVAGIAKMLVQSHTNWLDLLPALLDGEVKGSCARGGYVIDMQWQKGN